MFGNVRLSKDDVFLGIQTQSQILRQEAVRALAKNLGILKDGQGMEIREEIEAVVFFLQLLPIVNRPDVIPDRQITGDRASAQNRFFHMQNSKARRTKRETELCRGERRSKKKARLKNSRAFESPVERLTGP